MKQNHQISDFLKLFILLTLAVVLIYFFPVSIARLVFLLILPVAWKSNSDYFWLAFFFIMLDYPGGFYWGGAREDILRLPAYSIMPGFGFAIQELYFILIFIKALIKKNKYPDRFSSFFNKNILKLACLLLILLAVSPIIGMSIDSARKVYKIVISLSLFYSAYILIYSKEQLLKLFKMILPFSFVAIILITYSLIYKQQLVALVKPGILVTQGVLGLSGQIDRPIEMVHTLFICFTGSLFLLIYAKHNFNRYYLVFVNLISFVGIFLNATRSWFLAYISGYLVFFLVTKKTNKKYMRFVLIIAPLVFIVFSSIPIFMNQINSAWSRLETTQTIFKGDITAGGTLERISVRAPKVMEGFWASSIVLGAGFSDLFFKYDDGHVGYQNILLNTGLIGIMIFIYVIYKLLRLPFRLGKKYAFMNKPFIKISVIPLVMLLIVNMGTQTIGFSHIGDCRVFLMAFSVLLIKLSVQND